MAIRSGQVLLADMTAAWVEMLRDRLASRPHCWNGLRTRMKTVVDGYMRRHEDLLGRNPWERVKRLPTQESEQDRDWPDDVLIRIMRATTPEFRALITIMLSTARRIEDVVAFRPDQYDALRGVLRFQQRKTRTFVTLHMPIFLVRTAVGSPARDPPRTGVDDYERSRDDAEYEASPR